MQEVRGGDDREICQNNTPSVLPPASSLQLRASLQMLNYPQRGEKIHSIKHLRLLAKQGEMVHVRLSLLWSIFCCKCISQYLMIWVLMTFLSVETSGLPKSDFIFVWWLSDRPIIMFICGPRTGFCGHCCIKESGEYSGHWPVSPGKTYYTTQLCQ